MSNLSSFNQLGPPTSWNGPWRPFANPTGARADMLVTTSRPPGIRRMPDRPVNHRFRFHQPLVPTLGFVRKTTRHGIRLPRRRDRRPEASASPADWRNDSGDRHAAHRLRAARRTLRQRCVDRCGIGWYRRQCRDSRRLWNPAGIDMKFLPIAALPAVILGGLLSVVGFYLLWAERREERRNRRP